MRNPLQFAPPVLAFLLTFAAESRSAEPVTPEFLIERLLASTDVETFATDVEVVRGPGADREARGKAHLVYLSWAERSDVLPEDRLKDAWESAAKHYFLPQPEPTPDRYRVRYQEPFRLRMDEYKGGPIDDDVRPTHTTLFSRGQWKRYMPVTGDGTSSMSVYENHRFWPLVEVAFGIGVYAGSRLRSPEVVGELHPKASEMRFIRWENLIPALDRDRARAAAFSVPPNNGPPVPMLELQSKPFRDWGMGAVRFRIWFAPDHGWRPLVVEYAEAQPKELVSSGGSPKGKHFTFLPRLRYDWSEPVEIDGRPFFAKCIARHYDNSFLTDTEALREVWGAYEILADEFRFRNTGFDVKFPKGTFEINPRPGTNVIDQPRGVRYLVGEEGDVEDKTELPSRE